MSVSEIPLTVLHVASQAAVGVLAGAVTDAVFPDVGKPAEAASTLEVAMLTAEVGGQLMVNGFVAALLFKALRRMGEGGLADPTAGLAFTFAAFESQPHLKAKIARLSHIVARKVAAVDSTISAGFQSFEGRERAAKPSTNNRRNVVTDKTGIQAK